MSPDWLALRQRVEELALLLQGPNIDSLAVGKAFALVANSLKTATATTGQTSMRFDAVVKALDLTTPKSALTAFVTGG